MSRLLRTGPLLLAASVSLSGCFLAQATASQDAGPDGGGIVVRFDAGPFDGTVPDAGPIGEEDSGARDSGAPPRDDAGTACEEPPVCVGEVLSRCGVSRDCASESAYCDENAAPPRCAPRECTPSVTECQGSELVECDERGRVSSSTNCPNGCTAAGCSPSSDTCPGGITATHTGLGTLAFELCGQGHDFEFQATGSDCSANDPATSQDIVLEWTVETGRTYRLAVHDRDGSAFVDPAVYVRRVCDDPNSQIACADDRTTGPSGGWRAPLLEQPFLPGVYYIIVDSFDFMASSCGRVELEIF